MSPTAGRLKRCLPLQRRVRAGRLQKSTVAKELMKKFSKRFARGCVTLSSAGIGQNTTKGILNPVSAETVATPPLVIGGRLGIPVKTSESAIQSNILSEGRYGYGSFRKS